MNTIQKIRDNQTYQQILTDSLGGVLYNVANQNKYDTKVITALWHSLAPSEQSAAGGIMKGVFNFVEGDR